jgi:hypothetical protein
MHNTFRLVVRSYDTLHTQFMESSAPLHRVYPQLLALQVDLIILIFPLTLYG